MKFLDTFLDRITMYKLVFYGLIGLLLTAGIFGAFGILPYSPFAILYSTAVLIIVGIITNIIFAYVFEAPTNTESTYITTLILALIITPFRNIHDLPMLGWAALLAISSKYILAINKKHVFNPVAIAVVLTAFWLNDSASWWVGTSVMAPFVVVFGLLIVRKIQREDMVFTFFAAALITEGFFTITRGGDPFAMLKNVSLHSSLFFFAFLMLTEPLTTPPTKGLRLFYAGLVGFLFPPSMHLGSVYSTPELALVIGNIFSYLVSPKQKLILYLREKLQYGTDVMHFIFTPKEPLKYVPGQYMEWTLPHEKVDFRGNRRYFTLASSPTEPEIHLGVKFYPSGSSFKKALYGLGNKTPFVAASLAGDFTLPKKMDAKLVFIAGGIGITPFRSMIKYCVDMHQSRAITLFYANKKASEIAYTDVFTEAEKIGIKTIYTLTDKESVPSNWTGEIGRITPEMIKKYVPDFLDRTFYLSGPHNMVEGFEEVLKTMNIAQSRIKKDFFPGFV
ncbi:MAG TPA: oxidoreductase [Patescibacteria group bacterium]